VAVNDNVIENIMEISTKDLIEESMETSPLFYVAAAVNAIQYVPGYRMSYILGAGDNTTDPNGHVFYNREVIKRTYLYFFRVFSADSTSEVIKFPSNINFISLYPSMKFSQQPVHNQVREYIYRYG